MREACPAAGRRNFLLVRLYTAPVAMENNFALSTDIHNQQTA